MPVAEPALRRKAVEAIGAALSREDIENLVMEATGDDVYNTIGTKDDPRATLISKALARLERFGTARWLLSRILIAVTHEKLRMLIVRTWPDDTLIKLPKVKDQIANALRHLDKVLIRPLPLGLKYQLEPKHDAFHEMQRRTAELYAYKSLHEYLHILHLKLLIAEPALDGRRANIDFNGVVAWCGEISIQASPLVALSSFKDVESSWILQLEIMANSLKTAVSRSDMARCLQVSDTLQALARIHLSRLNARTFGAAKELSFEALVQDFPLDIETKEVFTQLVHAVRDLKPTVLARALKQSMWQDAENEISLIACFFDTRDYDFSEFSRHWFALKSRVRWLASLDPDDPWARQVEEISDEIDDALVEEKLDEGVKHRFEVYRNLFRFRFLAIDNMLTHDCSSLRTINEPLGEILKELGR